MFYDHVLHTKYDTIIQDDDGLALTSITVVDTIGSLLLTNTAGSLFTVTKPLAYNIVNNNNGSIVYGNSITNFRQINSHCFELYIECCHG